MPVVSKVKEKFASLIPFLHRKSSSQIEQVINNTNVHNAGPDANTVVSNHQLDVSEEEELHDENYAKEHKKDFMRSPSLISTKSLNENGTYKHGEEFFGSTASVNHNPVAVKTPDFKLEHRSKLVRQKTVDAAYTSNAIVVGNRFKLIEKLGKGSFGVAYHGVDLRDPYQSEPSVAIKLQRNERDSSCKREISMLQRLKGCTLVPQLVWSGHYKKYRAMAIELQGPNLGSLFEILDRQFSIETSAHVMIECINCIEQVHSKGIVHRDIKPQNFVIGLNDEKQIYIIDFGLSTLYLNEFGQHILYQDHCSPVGTARYASLGTHQGIHQTRRDDLESIGYMIVYFLISELPWQGVKDRNRVKKWRKIEEKKAITTNQQLCKDLPTQFCEYFDYVRSLKFDQQPDYDHMKEIFEPLLDKDQPLDWFD